MTNVCVIGDSVTWGARLPFRIAWANLLRNHLEKASENLISLYDLGVDGDTTRDVLKRFDVEMSARSPELVLLAVGVNDSLYRGSRENSEVPIDEYENNMRELVGRARRFTQKIVIVGLVKGSDDWTKPLMQSTTGKSYDKQRTKEYNEVARGIAESENVVFVDVMDRLSDDDFDDGLHPNTTGHLKIYEAVRELLDTMLEVKGEVQYTLVDRNDSVIGSKERDHLDESDIVRVSALWLTNADGKILVAKRPFEKRRDPNRWGPTVATLVEKDKPYRKAMVEAVESEIGMTGVEMKEGEKMLVEGRNTFYCQWFSAEVDVQIENLKLNSDEVQELRWVTEEELAMMVKTKPFQFVQSFERYLELHRRR